jgi:hypothetical protein
MMLRPDLTLGAVLPIFAHITPHPVPQDSRTEALLEADAPPDSWGTGTGGSRWLNDTGDSVAKGSVCGWGVGGSWGQEMMGG